MQLDKAMRNISKTKQFSSPEPDSKQTGESKVVLIGRIAPGWKVVQPLNITLEPDTDGSYVASDEVFQMCGVGNDTSEAVQDYIAALTEYYELLAAHDDEPTVASFQFLHSYLQPARG